MIKIKGFTNCPVFAISNLGNVYDTGNDVTRPMQMTINAGVVSIWTYNGLENDKRKTHKMAFDDFRSSSYIATDGTTVQTITFTGKFVRQWVGGRDDSDFERVTLTSFDNWQSAHVLMRYLQRPYPRADKELRSVGGWYEFDSIAPDSQAILAQIWQQKALPEDK